MAYFAPNIDYAGLHLPTFQDIKDFLTDGVKGIFGEDVYVDADSMDGQLISVFAKAHYDAMKALQFAYNNYSFLTCGGVVLSNLAGMIGAQRNTSTYSKAYLQLGGLPNTQILNGVAKDQAGNYWKLPPIVVLNANGFIYVTATCTTEGAITAPQDTITSIDTPMYGWTSVTNIQAASVGKPVEDDVQFYNRLKQTVAIPSRSIEEGLQSALLDIDGVTQAICKENDQDDPLTVDGEELPPHSITCIVEGGNEQLIGEQIRLKKGLGCYTNGTTEVTVYDEYNNISTMRFSRPVAVPIYVTMNIKPVYNYNSSYINDITARLVDYVNSIGISNDVICSVLIHEAYNCNGNLKQPAFSIDSLLIGTTAELVSTADISITLSQIATLEAANISITVGK